jgi:hypothetical protein
MAVTRASVIKDFHHASRKHGEMRVASDFSLGIIPTYSNLIANDGGGDDMGLNDHDSIWLYIKSQFWPELTPGEGIEVPTPLGSAMWQPSQCKFHQQASITFQESADAQVHQFLDALLECKAVGTHTTSTGRFDAYVYYGTPDHYIERRKIEDAFIVIDEATETNWESRTEILTFNAMIYFHYYGETDAPASADLCNVTS